MTNLTILERKEYEEYSEPAVIERPSKTNYVNKYEPPKNEITKKTILYLSVWEAEELNLKMPLSKTLYLAQWVSNSIKSNVGNYVNT